MATKFYVITIPALDADYGGWNTGRHEQFYWAGYAKLLPKQAGDDAGDRWAVSMCKMVDDSDGERSLEFDDDQSAYELLREVLPDGMVIMDYPVFDRFQDLGKRAGVEIIGCTHAGYTHAKNFRPSQ